MDTINGDILDIPAGTIVQQVNCQGVMGAGLAKQIRARWPIVFSYYTEFLELCKEFNVEPHGQAIVVNVGEDDEGYVTKAVAMLFAQDGYGGGHRWTQYDWFRSSLRSLVNNMDVAVPLPLYIPVGIGCGLGGGDWDTIRGIIEEEAPDAILVKRGA